MAVLQSGIDGGADVVAALDGQKILSDARRICAEQRPRGGVDAQNMAVPVEQDQTLAQIVGDLLEFVGLLPQRAKLAADLLMLLVDAPQQGRKLLVGVVFQRMLQVEPVERVGDLLGHRRGEYDGKHQRRKEDEQHRLEQAQRQRRSGGAADGDAQYGAVVEALRLIKQFFRQRVGRAGAAAVAGGKGLLNLLAVEMVFHGFLVGSGVKEHRAVLIDPRQAEAFLTQRMQVIEAVLLRAGCGEGKLVLQLAGLHLAKIAVKHQCRDEEARQKHQC